MDDPKRKKRFIFYIVFLFVFVAVAWWSGYKTGYEMGRRDFAQEINDRFEQQISDLSY